MDGAFFVAGASNYEHVELIPGWSTIKIGDKGFVADRMGYNKAFSKTDFDACYERAQKGDFNDIPITVIDKSDLIKEKMKLGRPKYIDDVQNLKKQ